ncbi:PEP-CTERM sorting domain-containing protein [Geminocystis sp. NIES-3708]|uniref:PEP-CTERM sorting domain-containing protein n=1 Tax=Geminocystis sp. NIES-3708 TaxID=1615909 RepID=UPI001E64BC17|nr:PEP-CTERM sorting domain-containing protein [Geminocystis sp. NIES-3708]
MASCVTSILSLGFSSNALAISFNLSTGQGTPNSGTLGNQGAFTTKSGTTTIDFNSLSLGALSDPYTEGIATFDTTSPIVDIRNDGFAPGFCTTTAPCSNAGVPVANSSNYLAIFQSNGNNGEVGISFSKDISYLGFNWGFADADNTTALFYNNGSPIASFTATQIFGSVDSEETGFVEFSGGIFDKVVFSQVGGGGFEIDNLAYQQVPEPLTILGSGLALGFGTLFKRKKSKLKQSC